MTKNILKFLWILIIFLFVSLQIYNLIRSNYADVVTSLLTVIILLALIMAYWLIDKALRIKETKEEKVERGKNELL